MKITTSYNFPPIPCRDMDWSAIDSDTYDCDCDQDGFYSTHPVGYGRTEAEAIADLRWRLGLEDETRCDQCDRPIDGDCFRSRIGEPLCESCWDESSERAAGVSERRSFQASWAGAR